MLARAAPMGPKAEVEGLEMFSTTRFVPDTEAQMSALGDRLVYVVEGLLVDILETHVNARGHKLVRDEAPT